MNAIRAKNGAWRLRSVACASMLAATGLSAQPQGQPGPQAATRSDAAQVEPAARAASHSGFGPAVGLQRLTVSRGGASTVSTQVDIGGTLKDASASHVTTGANAIREGSFSNAAGFNTVIQNSGANVLIQNSMTVNVQFK